jgi:hypothetical protein
MRHRITVLEVQHNVYTSTLSYSTRLTASFKTLYASKKLSTTGSVSDVQSSCYFLVFLRQNYYLHRKTSEYGCLFILLTL